MKRLKTPKFSFSLILNFLISTLIPFVLVTLLIANLYKYNYTRDVFNLVDNSLVSISQNIYLYLSELDRATLTPYYNEDFFATLKHIKESSGRQSVLEQAQLENSLGYLMSFIRYTREDIAGSIIVAGGDCIYSTTNMVDSSVDPDYPFSEQEWYREALALKGRPLFVSPHSQDYYVPNTNPQVISVARAIVNLRTRQPLCVIKVDANTVIFEKVLQDIVFHVPSTVIVTDQSGHVVYSTLPVDGLDEGDLSRDSVKINYGGQPYLKRSQPVRDYGWNVHVLLKESAVNSNIFYIYATSLLLYLVGLLTALAFYFWRSRRLIHTVDTINGLLEQIQNGNFKARYTPDSPNELKLIIDSVNYIAEMLEERMEREYQMAVEQKTFQFKALQAQINPHFLFNTLNSFIALNQMSMRGELESAIYSLTRMLRYSLGEGSTSTVAQELEFLENYCMLQKLRFQKRLEYRIQYDPDTGQTRIPKLLLQPLVENAIIHGIEPSGQNCHLNLSVFRLSSSRIMITIEDDGIGFDQEMATRHMGLSNVSKRLTLIDSRNCMEIESSPGEGTIITLEIQTEERHEISDC